MSKQPNKMFPNAKGPEFFPVGTVIFTSKKQYLSVCYLEQFGNTFYIYAEGAHVGLQEVEPFNVRRIIKRGDGPVLFNAKNEGSEFSDEARKNILWHHLQKVNVSLKSSYIKVMVSDIIYAFMEKKMVDFAERLNVSAFTDALINQTFWRQPRRGMCYYASKKKVDRWMQQNYRRFIQSAKKPVNFEHKSKLHFNNKQRQMVKSFTPGSKMVGPYEGAGVVCTIVDEKDVPRSVRENDQRADLVMSDLRDPLETLCDNLWEPPVGPSVGVAVVLDEADSILPEHKPNVAEVGMKDGGLVAKWPNFGSPTSTPQHFERNK